MLELHYDIVRAVEHMRHRRVPRRLTGEERKRESLGLEVDATEEAPCTALDTSYCHQAGWVEMAKVLSPDFGRVMRDFLRLADAHEEPIAIDTLEKWAEEARTLALKRVIIEP